MSKKRKGKKHERLQLSTVLPSLDSPLVQLADGTGMTFRKRILPLATIQYPKTARHPGGPVKFDRAFHRTLISAFRDRAYDAPPLQLADENNRHNMLPERTAGHIVDVSEEQPGDVDGPGLYATVKALSPQHAKLLADNPNLGVSPEIVQGLEKVDGRKFPAAIRHVLATLDPRVTGLGAWRAVSLSEDDHGQRLDLTSGNYEEIDMGKRKDKATEGAVLELSDDEMEAALQAAADEFDRLEGDDGTDEDEGDLGLSTVDDDLVLALAADNREGRRERRQIRGELAESKWEKRRLELANAGVPKFLLDAAGEVLAYAPTADSVIALSDSDGDEFTVDARSVIEKMLDKAQGLIDLSNPGGSVHDDPGANSEGLTPSDEALLNDAEKRFGA